MSKHCPQCDENKPISEFGKCSQAKSGVTSWCGKCSRGAVRKYRKENIEIVRATDRRRNARPNEDRAAKSKIRRAKWSLENKERIKETSKIHYEKNKEKIAAYRKGYKALNKGKVNASTAGRRAAKLNATPLWANKEKVKDIYINAKDKGMEVDHIIPLRSSAVCGLHWEYNLQLLLPKENASKGNRYEADV